MRTPGTAPACHVVLRSYPTKGLLRTEVWS